MSATLEATPKAAHEKGVIAQTPPIQVPKPCTADQVKFFVENGYLIMENMVSPAEIAELKADTFKLARGGYPCESLKPLPADMSDDEVLKNILCIHQPHYISPVMRKFVKHPGK
jgi:phytanoyl-CoA hydroxylase